MYRSSLCFFLALLLAAGLSAPCLGFEATWPGSPSGNQADGSALTAPARITARKGPIRVEIKPRGDAFRLYRGGNPYYIKGIGGHEFLEQAAAAGSNSVRTWDAGEAAALLDRTQALNMTVLMGIWLSHEPSDYLDPIYRKSKTDEIQSLVARHKNHPALLAWSLGNEINLEGADTHAAWQFVDSLARMIKEQDPNHPVITVIACNPDTLDHIAASAPHLDAVGINAYGAVSMLRGMIERSAYNGPYLITEWGVDGHWEAARTAWGRPIEPASAQKAEYHLLRYANDIMTNEDRCIGSYVFLWGHKQERTPTWYSLILENLPGTDTGGVSSPAVDVMHFNWTGAWPVNRAPLVFDIRVNDVTAEHNVVLSPGQPMVSRVAAGDPENDPLSFIWELLEEPTDLGTGGSFEPRPRRLVSTSRDNLPVLSLRAPLVAGDYRLFVYVLDHNGHAGTANFPFRVSRPSEREAQTIRTAVGPG